MAKQIVYGDASGSHAPAVHCWLWRRTLKAWRQGRHRTPRYQDREPGARGPRSSRDGHHRQGRRDHHRRRRHVTGDCCPRQGSTRLLRTARHFSIVLKTCVVGGGERRGVSWRATLKDSDASMELEGRSGQPV